MSFFIAITLMFLLVGAFILVAIFSANDTPTARDTRTSGPTNGTPTPEPVTERGQ